MGFKSQKLGLFSVTAISLVLGLTFHALKAEGITKVNCGQKLLKGETYHTFHQGPDLAFTGLIRITKVAKCPKGTCFQGEMTFDNYNSVGADKAEGHWSGANIEFIRHVGKENSTQKWSGECIANSVRGQWQYTNNPNNRGLAVITY